MRAMAPTLSSGRPVERPARSREVRVPALAAAACRRWALFPLLALLLLAPTGCARSLSAQETGTLTGMVLDRATRRPLPDVVILVQGTQMGTSTGADGRFRIADIPTGPHLLLVQH